MRFWLWVWAEMRGSRELWIWKAKRKEKINVNAKEHFRLTDMNIKLIHDIKRRLAKCYTYLLRVRFFNLKLRDASLHQLRSAWTQLKRSVAAIVAAPPAQVVPTFAKGHDPSFLEAGLSLKQRAKSSLLDCMEHLQA